MDWRPDKWAYQRNRYFKHNQPKPPYYKTRQLDFEAGADAMLEALWRLAEESPTKTFIIDSRDINIYEVKYED